MGTGVELFFFFFFFSIFVVLLVEVFGTPAMVQVHLCRFGNEVFGIPAH
jgi:hypothetical protein